MYKVLRATESKTDNHRQILDKTVLGYGATFGLQEATNLTGNQYSLVGSIAPFLRLGVLLQRRV